MASEIVAGLVCGSKLWTFELVKPIWDWLTPRLICSLENADTDSMRNWGTSLATICGMTEPRQVYWLVEALFSLVEKPCENSFHATA